MYEFILTYYYLMLYCCLDIWELRLENWFFLLLQPVYEPPIAQGDTHFSDAFISEGEFFRR